MKVLKLEKNIYTAVKTALSHYISDVGVVVTDSFVKDTQGHLTEALGCLPRSRGPDTSPFPTCLSTLQIN